MTHVTHLFPVRVYYEDTDHGGVVYYANYLKFMERARTELLRDAGLELDALEREFGVLFAVTEAHLRYMRPARFNDLLHVESALVHLRGARLAFAQRIVCDGALLVEGDIRLACIGRDGRARRIPRPVLARIRPEASE